MSPMMTDSELLKQRLDRPPWYRVVEPEGVVRRLNELFQTGNEPTQYFTIVYGLLHLASGRLRLAAAGHPGPVIVPAGGDPFELDCRSFPVGLFEDADFCEHELVLNVGDRIWLYSDGVTDVQDGDQRMLGARRLRARMAEQRQRGVREAVEAVMQAVEDWSAPCAPEDDCTLLAIERQWQRD
jgi:sigma-B regulation protein RsbU (phosphoserine phosphatase)